MKIANRRTREGSAESGATHGAAMPPATEVIEQWLDRLDAALQSESRVSVAELFAPDGHWRDLLAFTWSITPSQGAEAIAAYK